MKAMLGLVNDWDPIATVDLHVTDGAKFEHDVSIQVEPLQAAMRRARSRQGIARCRDCRSGAGRFAAAPFIHRSMAGDPASGVTDSDSARSTGYFRTRNRLACWSGPIRGGMPDAVRITRNTVVVLSQIAANGRAWRKSRGERRWPPVALTYRQTASPSTSRL
jgi:hypothetical protein